MVSEGATEIIGFMMGAGWLLISVALLIFAINLIKKTKSKWYRKYLSNLYVASKIRQYAVEEKLDLESEAYEFAKYERKSPDKVIRDFDDKIEEELNAKIEQVIDEKDRQDKSKVDSIK